VVTNLLLGFSFFLFFFHVLRVMMDGWITVGGTRKRKWKGGGIRYTGSVDSIIFLSFAALCGE